MQASVSDRKAIRKFLCRLQSGGAVLLYSFVIVEIVTSGKTSGLDKDCFEVERQAEEIPGNT